MPKLKEPFLAVGIHVIRNRRTTQNNRLAQNHLHGTAQLAELLPRETRRSAPRTDARPEQRFIGVDVAHASQEFLIQKRTLDRRLPPAKQRPELLFSDLQRLDAAGIESIFMHAELPEHPRIHKPQFT